MSSRVKAARMKHIVYYLAHVASSMKADTLEETSSTSSSSSILLRSLSCPPCPTRNFSSPSLSLPPTCRRKKTDQVSSLGPPPPSFLAPL
eukprot:667060-Pyramimonas_sp.AAC.1